MTAGPVPLLESAARPRNGRTATVTLRAGRSRPVLGLRRQRAL